MTNKTLSISINICIYTLWVGVLLLFLHSLFCSPSHDWDIDAFLYIGSRLKHGELLYFKDFETKLPLLQYLFAIASRMGGVGAWRIISFAIAIIFSIIGARIIAIDIISQKRWLKFNRNNLTLLISGVLLFTIYRLPGSISGHIEIIAVTAAFLSIALLIAHKNNEHKILFLSGLALSFAALIRPNFIYLIPSFIIFLFVKNTHSKLIRNYIKNILIYMIGFLSFIIIVAIPYLFYSNGFSVLVNGIKAIAFFDSKGIGFTHLYHLQTATYSSPAFFYLFVYAVNGIAVVCLLFCRSDFYSGLWKYLFLSASSVTLLDLSLLQTHYYPHNSIMFSPFIILPILALFSIGSKCNHSLLIRSINFVIGLTVLYTIIQQTHLVLLLLLTFFNGKFIIDTHINHRNIDNHLLSFLSSNTAKNKSFLAVDNPIYHMLLDERRIGDGHPAMLRNILKGKKIGPINKIPLYADKIHANPCLAVLNSQKDIIILHKGHNLSYTVEQCLKKADTHYSRLIYPKIDNYTIYIKQN